jgi:hypothetical protein
MELAKLPHQYTHVLPVKKVYKYDGWNTKWNYKNDSFINNTRNYTKDDIKRPLNSGLWDDNLRYCECCGLELLDFETGKYCTSCKDYFKDDKEMEDYFNYNLDKDE